MGLTLAEINVYPVKGLKGIALEKARCTDRGIEQIAADCGLTPLMLRRHFARRWGITPQAYRRRFTQLAS